MLRKILLAASLLLLLLPVKSHAQKDKIVPYAGFTYNFLTVYEEPGGLNPYLSYYYGFTVGMNYVLMHSNDMVSLNANPNVGASLAFTSGGVSFLGQVPLFLLARVGASATPFNESRFGVGAGVGLNITYMSLPGFFLAGSSLEPLRQTTMNPSVVGEVNIDGRGGYYSIRGMFSLYRPTYEIYTYDFSFGTTTLGVTYNF